MVLKSETESGYILDLGCITHCGSIREAGGAWSRREGSHIFLVICVPQLQYSDGNRKSLNISVCLFIEIVHLQALGQCCVERAQLSCDLCFGRGEQPFPVTECQLADRQHARLSRPLRERAPRR